MTQSRKAFTTFTWQTPDPCLLISFGRELQHRVPAPRTPKRALHSCTAIMQMPKGGLCVLLLLLGLVVLSSWPKLANAAETDNETPPASAEVRLEQTVVVASQWTYVQVSSCPGRGLARPTNLFQNCHCASCLCRSQAKHELIRCAVASTWFTLLIGSPSGQLQMQMADCCMTSYTDQPAAGRVYVKIVCEYTKKPLRVMGRPRPKVGCLQMCGTWPGRARR